MHAVLAGYGYSVSSICLIALVVSIIIVVVVIGTRASLEEV